MAERPGPLDTPGDRTDPSAATRARLEKIAAICNIDPRDFALGRSEACTLSDRGLQGLKGMEETEKRQVLIGLFRGIQDAEIRALAIELVLSCALAYDL